MKTLACITLLVLAWAFMSSPIVTKNIADTKAEEKAELQKAIEAGIADHEPVVGMTQNQAISTWGEPEHVNRTETKDVIHDQWVYGKGEFLYFENGFLTTKQENGHRRSEITQIVARAAATPEPKKGSWMFSNDHRAALDQPGRRSGS